MLNAFAVRQTPTAQNQARLRLATPGLLQRDGISTYQVLGILLVLDDGTEVSTVGLNESLAEHIHRSVLPQYAESGEDELFTELFALPAGNYLSLWGNAFSNGFGYVRLYNLNGIHGTLVIVASYDSILMAELKLNGETNGALKTTNDQHKLHPDTPVCICFEP